MFILTNQAYVSGIKRNYRLRCPIFREAFFKGAETDIEHVLGITQTLFLQVHIVILHFDAPIKLILN